MRHADCDFSRLIPFYNASEATEAIRPLLGNAYHRDENNFLLALWHVYKQCQWVDSDLDLPAKSRSLKFQRGRIPPLGLTSSLRRLGFGKVPVKLQAN